MSAQEARRRSDRNARRADEGHQTDDTFRRKCPPTVLPLGEPVDAQRGRPSAISMQGDVDPPRTASR